MRSHLALARSDELVDDDLGAVREVAELRLPDHQRVRVGERVAVLEAEHAVLGEEAVEDLEVRLLGRQVVERDVAFLGLLIDTAWRGAGRRCRGRCPGRERRTREALVEQRAEGQRARRSPNRSACPPRSPAAWLDDALELADGRGSRPGIGVERRPIARSCSSGTAVAPRSIRRRRRDAGPPRRLPASRPCSACSRRGLERILQLLLEVVEIASSSLGSMGALSDQPLGVDLAQGRVLGDGCTSAAG